MYCWRLALINYFGSIWDECNCMVAEHSSKSPFFGIAIKMTFPVLWPLLTFPNLMAYWVQHFNSITSFFFETNVFYFIFSFIFISWMLISLQYCSGFCHTLIWISHGFTFIPHPDPLSHLPLYPILLGLPNAPGLSTCLMHPTWAGDLFHYRWHTCFNAILLKHLTVAFSHRVQKSVLYICVCISEGCFAYRVIINIFLNSIYMC